VVPNNQNSRITTKKGTGKILELGTKMEKGKERSYNKRINVSKSSAAGETGVSFAKQ
jgi:hypothetical protein